MISRYILVLLCILFLRGIGFTQMDDTTFVGNWKIVSLNVGGEPSFKRCDSLKENEEGFRLLPNQVIYRHKPCAEGKCTIIQGKAWSLNMGHFDFQYFDSTLKKEVIERFEYLRSNKNIIYRVGYTEQQRTEDSGFAGYWKLSSESTEKEVIYVRADTLLINEDGFYLAADEGSQRRIHSKSKKKKFIDLRGLWWSNKEGYFDMQYSNPERKLIIIEGFTSFRDGNQLKLRRTRYDELRNP